MNLPDYLDPADASPLIGGVGKDSSTLANTVLFKHGKSFPTLTPGDVVMIGFRENRNSSNSGASKSPDIVRKYFYGLASFQTKVKIIDAGNLKATKTPTDSYSAVKDIIDFFVEKKVSIVILGGTQEVSFPIYEGIKKHRKSVSCSFIDSRIDMGEDNGDFSSTSYLRSFMNESNDNLFNISLLGYQGYFVDPQNIESLSKSHHETLRLGFVRGNFREVEPTVRDSDFVSFDLGAIRHSDCPGNIFPSPNGLYAEEACQLARYTGLSDKNCCFGVFEHNPDADIYSQSANLSAQLVWHYIEALSQRKGEIPSDSSNFKKFIVDSNTPGIQMVFIKSLLSDNWWMEVPTDNIKLYPKRKVVVACSYNDYLIASRQEVPDRWLRIFNKLL